MRERKSKDEKEQRNRQDATQSSELVTEPTKSAQRQLPLHVSSRAEVPSHTCSPPAAGRHTSPPHHSIIRLRHRASCKFNGMWRRRVLEREKTRLDPESAPLHPCSSQPAILRLALSRPTSHPCSLYLPLHRHPPLTRKQHFDKSTAVIVAHDGASRIQGSCEL